VADLLDDLDEVRRRGYAIDNEETAEGIICLGVAIPRRAGGDPYGVSVTLLKARAEPARVAALAADLKRLARLLADPLDAGSGDGNGRTP
jgi:DNA-binding IclR family transcriptional regulator